MTEPAMPLAEAICTSQGLPGLYSVPVGQRQAFIGQAGELLRHLSMQGYKVVSIRPSPKLALLDTSMRRLPERWRPVVEDVCKTHHATVANVMSGDRERTTAHARHAVWFAIRDKFGVTYAELGRRFGFHHTSVLHGVRLHGLRLAGLADEAY